MDFAFEKMLTFGSNGMEMHDPLAIAFAIDLFTNKPQAYTSEFGDVKVENQGVYTRGMAIIDRRSKVSTKVREEYKQKEKIFDVWNSTNANNVEVVTFYDFDSFIRNLFKIIFNVE
jgi:inosine-uridine nucleoside N-ribohydrolase